jgi:cytochrome c2
MTTALVLLCISVAQGEDAGTLEGNPFRGREIFAEKGCSRCHSVWGHGGVLGPDIVVAVKGKTWYELVGDFWNHTPRMLEEVAKEGHDWPTLKPGEMSDTLSYLYYLRLFDEPGDPVRGMDTYSRLHCDGCHTLGGHGGDSAGSQDQFGAYPSPAPLAQAMWNAGPIMQKEQLRRGNPIPQFTGHEMADLQAHIRAEGIRRGREIVLQELPDPTRGAEVYRKKQCGACHDGARGAPDVRHAALSRTASEITGLLWNHGYAMSSLMAERGIPFPQFSGTELSDLIAHLYFLGYAGEEGDPHAGSEVFTSKGCGQCHQGTMEGVTDLTAGMDRTDRVALAAAMWNHAPEMHRLMASESPFWPKFEPGEMRNLVAYLRTRSPPAGGTSGAQ